MNFLANPTLCSSLSSNTILFLFQMTANQIVWHKSAVIYYLLQANGPGSFKQQSVVWHSLWAFSEDTVKGPYDPHSKWVKWFCNFSCISVKRNRTREVKWLAWGHRAKPRRIGAVSPTSTPTFFSLPAPCLSALRLMALIVGFYITVTFKLQNVMFSQPCYN